MTGRPLPWLLAALALGVLFLALYQTRLGDPAQGALARPLLGLAGSLRRLPDSFAGLGASGELRRQNEALRQERERLLAEIARLREEVTTAQQLGALAQVAQERPQDRFLLARVIAREPNPRWRSVAIDRGRRDGVEEGLAVLGPGGGLLGTVARVYERLAWVTLINDPRSAVNALVQPSRGQGVASGSAQGRLSLEYVPQGVSISPGDLVVTSGLGGGYPKALLLGRVTAVRGSPQEPFLKVGLEPAASLERLETVLVLLSYQPPSLRSP